MFFWHSSHVYLQIRGIWCEWEGIEWVSNSTTTEQDSRGWTADWTGNGIRKTRTFFWKWKTVKEISPKSHESRPVITVDSNAVTGAKQIVDDSAIHHFMPWGKNELLRFCLLYLFQFFVSSLTRWHVNIIKLEK